MKRPVLYDKLRFGSNAREIGHAVRAMRLHMQAVRKRKMNKPVKEHYVTE